MVVREGMILVWRQWKWTRDQRNSTATSEDWTSKFRRYCSHGTIYIEPL